MSKKEELTNAILKSVESKQKPNEQKRLTCAQAFELAKNLDAEIIEIGRICNQHNIRICKCQLGCFA
jgi:hypothetical protein